MRSLILIGLLLMSCGKKSEATIPLVFDTTYTVYEPTGTATGQRAFLIHGGFNGSRNDWNVEPFLTFRETLQAAGIELITFDLPHMRDYHMLDGGAAYRAGFEAQLRQIHESVELERGAATETLVGGFSLGGLHTLMSIALCPDLFNRYFAILPVTELSWMPEIKFDTPDFNPFNEITNLKTKQGLMSWGTLDERVNFRLSIELADDIGASVHTIEYEGLDHTTTPQVASDTADWITN